MLSTIPEALRVGGLTPLTSVDFPGALAAVIYCRGCPWRCAYCHNGHLLRHADAVDGPDWPSIMAFLESRRGLLDGVVFSGGEPTVQVALAAAVAEVRALGFRVGLHTGGAYPQRLQSLLPRLDWVGLDIKALPEDYPRVTGVRASGERAWQSLRLLLAADVALEVRTTPMPGLDDDAYLEALMGRLAEAGVTDYALQQCQPHHLLHPAIRSQIRSLPSTLGAAMFERFEIRAA